MKMWGMPAGFANLLRRKYDLMQQDANARTQQANTGAIVGNAAANLDVVRAGLMPAESRVGIEKTKADTANTLESTKYVGPLAQSQIGLQSTQGKLNLANVGAVNEETAGNRQLNRYLNLGMFRRPAETDESSLRLGLSPRRISDILGFGN
jgi:hypothetical protein